MIWYEWQKCTYSWNGWRDRNLCVHVSHHFNQKFENETCLSQVHSTPVDTVEINPLFCGFWLECTETNENIKGDPKTKQNSSQWNSPSLSAIFRYCMPSDRCCSFSIVSCRLAPWLMFCWRRKYTKNKWMTCFVSMFSLNSPVPEGTCELG
jgi:hypothetical protein